MFGLHMSVVIVLFVAWLLSFSIALLSYFDYDDIARASNIYGDY